MSHFIYSTISLNYGITPIAASNCPSGVTSCNGSYLASLTWKSVWKPYEWLWLATAIQPRIPMMTGGMGALGLMTNWHSAAVSDFQSVAVQRPALFSLDDMIRIITQT